MHEPSAPRASALRIATSADAISPLLEATYLSQQGYPQIAAAEHVPELCSFPVPVDRLLGLTLQLATQKSSESSEAYWDQGQLQMPNHPADLIRPADANSE